MSGRMISPPSDAAVDAAMRFYGTSNRAAMLTALAAAYAVDRLVPLAEVLKVMRDYGGGHHVRHEDGSSSYALHSVESQIAELERRFGGDGR